jgi:hypothetical protein
MDVLAELRAALERFAEFRRRSGGPRKQKKVKVANRRPAKMGASAGCGTGAGGFKAGNNCAVEDGIPRKPLSQGGALKGANAKGDLARAKAMREKAAAKKAKKEAADKAKSAATRPQREAARLERKKSAEKQKRIDELRRAAAERKAQKGERDAAEKQAASEAAAAKKTAMLQKIRIKKANEQLKVVEKPPSIFSGQAAQATKNAGETEVEFQIRRHKQDLDKLHSESARIEADYDARIAKTQSDIDKLGDSLRSHERDQVMFNSNRDAWNSKHEEIKDSIKQQQATLKAHEAERDNKLHALVGEFTRSYAGGTASVSADVKDYKISAQPKVSQEDYEDAKSALKDAWRWLSRVAAPKHSKTIARQTIAIRTGGGSHSGSNEEVTIGAQDRGTTRKTAVHEYGHAIENADARTLRALDEDFTKRANDFLANEKGSRIMGMDAVPFYECLYKAREQRQHLDIYAPSHLGYARRYSDCGYSQKKRQEHPNNPRVNRGTEVFSTGIESIYREPAAFRRRARHGFDLSVLILAGIM